MQESFTILLELYRPLIQRIAARSIFGYNEKERTELLMTCLFELISSTNTFPQRSKMERVLTSMLQKRVKGEKISWKSLDEVVGDGDNTLVNFLDEERELSYSHLKTAL